MFVCGVKRAETLVLKQHRHKDLSRISPMDVRNSVPWFQTLLEEENPGERDREAAVLLAASWSVQRPPSGYATLCPITVAGTACYK